MALRSDAPELAVDELRRKARRRLVGAVVLALAAAVLLPLLLENEPKPLGDNVSIQIPPVDSGKFVNPLSPGVPVENAGKGSGEAATAPRASNETGKIDSSAASASPSAESSRTPAAEKVPTPPAEKAAPQSVPANEAPKPIPETKAAGVAAGAKAEPAASEPRAQAKAAANAEIGSDSAKTSGAFVVQIAAFSDRYGARSLVAKLKKVGFPAFTEAVTTDKGTLHRVRVGPYPSREVADAARAKLKAAGFAGVVARNA